MSNRVYMLLDRSSSMSRQWSDTLGAVNGYVQALPPNTNVYLATFDSPGGLWGQQSTMAYDVIRNTVAGEWKPIEASEVMPRGGTPLLDAAARIMDRAFEDTGERTVLVVMTDGEENSSKVANLALVREKVKRFQDRHWEVVFLGADFSGVSEQAASFGLDNSKFVNTSQGMRGLVMNNLAGKTETYFNETNIEVATASMSYSKEEQTVAEKK